MSKKKITWMLFILLITAGAVAHFSFVKKVKDAEAKMETAQVTKETLQESVTAQGTLEPKDYVDVGVQVSGQIQKLYVDIGDEVKKNDLLAEIDPSTYESAIASNQAEIKSLQAQIKQEEAQADYDALQLERSKKLIKIRAISQEDLEEKEKALKISRATIEALEAQKMQAEANLKTNQINLGYTKIYAPMDGIVSEREANEGQTLNANQTTPDLLTISNLSVMTIRAEIAEADVMRLKAGMQSSFSTFGDFDHKWVGTIRQILPTPEVVNDVVLYNALIDVDNKDGKLMNGMSTQNTFITEKVENALVIPTRALSVRLEDQDNDKGEAYRIHVLRGHETESRIIHVGLVTRAKAEVRSGLSFGETVIVTGAPEGEATGIKKDKGPPMLGGL